VLFVSHYAGRTGAPVVLLNLQRWLREHSQLRFATILRQGGTLAEEFGALAETIVAQPSPSGPSLLSTVRRRFGSHTAAEDLLARLSHWRSRSFGLIYSNTVTNGAVVSAVARPGTPVITHVHEMDYWIEKHGRENWEQVREQTTLFVAASKAVARNLCDRRGIPTAKIEVVHEFVPSVLPPGTEDRGRRQRAELGLPAEAFVVAGGGAEMWRKGRDLFVQVAAQMLRASPDRPCFFVWVGSMEDAEAQHWLRHDARVAGIANRMRWVGEVTNPLDYFAACDAFVMVSREDPFPLVCLEAALLGKPIVCFADAGGIPELVEADAGYAVRYLDLAAMTERLLQLSRDDGLRMALGARAAEKVREKYSLEVAAPRLLAIMNRLIHQSSALSSSQEEL